MHDKMWETANLHHIKCDILYSYMGFLNLFTQNFTLCYIKMAICGQPVIQKSIARLVNSCCCASAS